MARAARRGCSIAPLSGVPEVSKSGDASPALTGRSSRAVAAWYQGAATRWVGAVAWLRLQRRSMERRVISRAMRAVQRSAAQRSAALHAWERARVAAERAAQPPRVTTTACTAASPLCSRRSAHSLPVAREGVGAEAAVHVPHSHGAVGAACGQQAPRGVHRHVCHRRFVALVAAQRRWRAAVQRPAAQLQAAGRCEQQVRVGAEAQRRHRLRVLCRRRAARSGATSGKTLKARGGLYTRHAGLLMVVTKLPASGAAAWRGAGFALTPGSVCTTVPLAASTTLTSSAQAQASRRPSADRRTEPPV